jgi:hypothetical protein
MEVMVMYGIYAGICVLVVGVVFMSTSSKPLAKVINLKGATVLTVAERIWQRRHYKYLERKIGWSYRRLTTNCRRTTKERAFRYLEQAIAECINARFGVKKQIFNRAWNILNQLTVPTAKVTPRVSAKAVEILLSFTVVNNETDDKDEEFVEEPAERKFEPMQFAEAA